MINSANENEPGPAEYFLRNTEKNPKFYKEFMSSLALLPPRDFAFFERQFPPEYYTGRAKNFTMYSIPLAL